MMTAMGLSDYDELETVLNGVGSDLDAAQAHGLIGGVLCVRAASPEAVWRDELLGEPAPGDVLYREADALMRQLASLTREQMHDSNLGFDLLLPDDETPLRERVQALAQWCRGFLSGLGLAGVDRASPMPRDSAEILRDVAEIARAGVSDTLDEGDEQAYAELVEYLRMGVLLMAEELQPVKAPARRQ
jgi:uncharacterized protein YgfB (UPF0149 family)